MQTHSRCYVSVLRLYQNRRLEATVTGMLGWAYVKAGDFERALEAFRRIDKVPPAFSIFALAVAWRCLACPHCAHT